MKKLLLVVFLILLGFEITQAEVYLIVEDSSKEIKSMSNEDDAVLPDSGHIKVILPGELSQYPLLHHPKYYKYKGKKFVMNTKKISDEEILADKKAEERIEWDLIQAKIWNKAYNELVTEGVIFKHATLHPEIIP